MTERKDLWWVLPVSAALLVLIAASGAANFIYGLDFGGPIIGGVSIASDLIKVVALIGVFSLWRNRHRLQAGALAILFIGFTVWSMISAVGFISSKFSTLQDTRGKTASAWQELTEEIARVKAQREKVLDVRPQATIQAEINSILRIPGVNGCVAIDGPVTRQHCPRYGELKAELGHAERSIWLDGRLEALRAELNKTDRVTIVDPRTDSFAEISGAGAASIILFVKFFIAILIEGATAFGLWAVWSPFFGRVKELQKAPPQPVIVAKPVDIRPDLSRRPAPSTERIGSEQLKALAEWKPAPKLEKPVTPPDPEGGTPKAVEPAAVEEKPSTVVSFPVQEQPKSSKRAKDELLRKLENEDAIVISEFVDARLNVDCAEAEIKKTPSGRWKSGGSPAKKIHTEYVQFCEENGYHALKAQQFGSFIRAHTTAAGCGKRMHYGAVIAERKQQRRVA